VRGVGGSPPTPLTIKKPGCQGKSFDSLSREIFDANFLKKDLAKPRFKAYAVRMNDTKITNRKTTVALTTDFKNHKKGSRFSVKCLNEEGLLAVCGNDWEVIPHKYLGEYEETFNKVTKNDNVVTTEKVVIDVTNEWLNHWKKLADRKAVLARREEITKLKKHITGVRNTIEYVKNGNAEKELDNLLAELAKLI
jgi:hypothetical protein